MKYYYYGFTIKDGKEIESIGTNNGGIIELKTLKGVENRIRQYMRNNVFDSYIMGVNIYDYDDNKLSTILF